MRQARLFIGLGIALHVVFFVLMLLGVEPFHTFFYLFAWWTFIPVIGVINAGRAGNSLIVGPRQQLAWVAGYSVIVWLFFEIWNFRLHNWLYVGVIELTWLRWLAYTVSFATVLPAILELERLLGNLGIAGRVPGPVIRVSERLLNACVIAGLVMLALVLVLPRYCFPLLWVGVVFILDPLIYRRDRVASLLGQAAQGSYALFVRLMLAGLVCGVLWEFWTTGQARSGSTRYRFLISGKCSRCRWSATLASCRSHCSAISSGSCYDSPGRPMPGGAGES